MIVLTTIPGLCAIKVYCRRCRQSVCRLGSVRIHVSVCACEHACMSVVVLTCMRFCLRACVCTRACEYVCVRAYACAWVPVSISYFCWVHVAVYESLMLYNVCVPVCILACVHAVVRAGFVMLARCLMRTSRAPSLKSTC